MSKRRREEQNSSPSWLTTYSDLVTLLLTFFVLLYTFSSIDAAKFKQLAVSLQMALTGRAGESIFDGSPQPIGDLLDDVVTIPEATKKPVKDEASEDGLEILDKEIEKIYQIVKGFVEEEELEADVRLRVDRRGVIIDISDNILFDPGEAELKPESKLLLDKLTKLITAFDNNIIVEGHTDNVPIKRSKFATNWELSVNRATTVVRYFAEEKNIAPNRLSAAGYGEYRPIVPNDTPENRALNRRVNILIEVTLEGGSEGAANDRE
ncbi:MAG TPA: OmpA family protein [Clostridiales bacterium]|nr:OmpA family protein [Clostridiales bacterium]